MWSFGCIDEFDPAPASTMQMTAAYNFAGQGVVALTYH